MLLWSSGVFVVWEVVEQRHKFGRGCLFSVNERTAATSDDAEFSVRLDSKSLLQLRLVTGLNKLRRRKLKQWPRLRCEATRTAAFHERWHLSSHCGRSGDTSPSKPSRGPKLAPMEDDQKRSCS